MTDQYAIGIGKIPISTRVVTIDQWLVWEKHVDKLSKRVSSAVSALRQICRYVPQETLISIYNALIKPLFDYCDAVWGNLNWTLKARLRKLQNRADRIIIRKGYEERSLNIRKQLGWDDLETTRYKHIAIFMNKTLNELAPSYLSELFSSSDNRYTMREKGSRLLLPKFNSEFSKRILFLLRGQRYGTLFPTILGLLRLYLFSRNTSKISLLSNHLF